MAKLNIPKTRDLLQGFDFKTVFIEELGWSQPASRRPVPFDAADESFLRAQIAELSGVVVFEVTASDGRIPDAKTRAAIHKQTAKLHHENLLIFVDGQRTQSLWYWVKREEGKSFPREHWYFNGQPGDLFLSKLSSMVVDISEFDESGRLPIVEVASRLKKALDVEHVTKKFYAEFQQEHIAFLEYIKGIDDERDRRWYASIMLNRLMFVYFLQKKYFINNGDDLYLRNKLVESRERGRDLYYPEFLTTLFFEGFAKPEEERSEKARTLLGTIKYLNGGLFLEHRIELDWKRINIADKAFDNLFALFGRYSWNLNDTPGGEDNELNPDVLGYIFEKYINQKAFGAYYTRPEITEYLCERTIHKLILDRVNKPAIPGALPARQFESIAEMLMNLDAQLCGELINDVLPDLRLLDPACGSGAFLVSGMKTLIGVYSAVIGRIKFLSSSNLTRWLKGIEREHDPAYFIKKKIITDNLFGVDIMEEAVEIAKLRLFLALVASAQTVDQLEPLPNIDFNILAGNSLIGLMHVDDHEFDKRYAQGHLFVKPYREVLAEKNRLIDNYRRTTSYADDLRKLRDSIDEKKKEALGTLNDILLHSFVDLGIKFEEATWDDAKKKEGKPKKRALRIQDIEAQRPFHWGYEFDQIINERGGFDAIITNPPWEVFKPQAKEFFSEYSGLVTKNRMTIKEFEKEQAKLLMSADIRKAWLEYQTRFPYVSQYFRSVPQYTNQIAIINGKRAGTDINSYKLFLEQCFNLLRASGRCGILVPTGIYSDLGAKQLREVLFSKCALDTLVGLSNERFLFEGVDHRFKFCLLTFEKGGITDSFRAAFRMQPREAISPSYLSSFLHNKFAHVVIPVSLVRRLSPESISVMEFKVDMDISIAEKMMAFPCLGEKIGGKWNLALTREFDMTNDSNLFRAEPSQGRLPLYEGKMIHQFDHKFKTPRYWIDESKGRKAVARRSDTDKGQELSYEKHRLAFRDIARNTDMRTLIAAIIPRRVFAGNTIILSQEFRRNDELLFVLAAFNSLACDYVIRQKVSAHCNMFYVYQLPVPRLTPDDAAFSPIVSRAAELTCTTPEFDDLAREVGLGSHKNGVTDPTERAKLRAELDGMIAHLYGLTEEEFTHILSTFPIVEQSVKDAALEAYRELAPKPGDQEIAALIAKGESAELEFKASARWDMRQDKPNKEMEAVIIKTVASFLNAEAGGTLLIGVEDNGNVLGLQHDYKTLGRKQDRDGFENWLTTLLLDAYGKDTSPLIRITFHEVESKEVCRVIAQPSPKPVFVRDDKAEHLYIRTGNSTRLLSTREAIEYCKMRWR
jgi:hypothetical protein